VKRSDIFHLCCLVATESQTEKACFNPWKKRPEGYFQDLANGLTKIQQK
jgi:hypothetical protein